MLGDASNSGLNSESTLEGETVDGCAARAKGKAAALTPRVLSTTDWPQLDKKLQESVKKAKKTRKFPAELIAWWIMVRQRCTDHRQLSPGVPISSFLEADSVMWATFFCSVSREDDSTTRAVSSFDSLSWD
jgi:hypothetical protein